MALSVPMLDGWLEQHHPVRDHCQESLRTSSLGGHASWYRDNLSHCSEAMLHYEWAWMGERIAALNHGRFAAGGDGATGPQGIACPPEPRLAELLSESQLFHTLLLREFAARGLRPLPLRGPVVASEEAWNIASASVRQAWGIQP